MQLDALFIFVPHLSALRATTTGNQMSLQHPPNRGQLKKGLTLVPFSSALLSTLVHARMPSIGVSGGKILLGCCQNCCAIPFYVLIG